MKKTINWSAVPGAMLLAGVMAIVFMAVGDVMGATNLPALGIVGFVVSMALAFMPGNVKGQGIAMMAVQVEIWQNDIIENLFKNNEFLLRATDESQYIMQGKVVHIPQAGANPNVEKNRASLPATAAQRTDSDVTYTVDTYSTDPFLITKAEEVELSYNKRMSVLNQHIATLNQTMADNVLVTWAAAGITLNYTTGENKDAVFNATVAGTQRKKATLADIQAIANTMNRQNVPMNDRVIIMSADMYQDIVEAMSLTQFRDFSAGMDPKTGVVGRLLGFDIYMRSKVVYFSSAAAVKTVAAADAADDLDAAIAFQMNSVAKAMGPVVFFERLKDPTYYGDVYSIEARLGARVRRSDFKGVVALLSAATGGN